MAGAGFASPMPDILDQLPSNLWPGFEKFKVVQARPLTAPRRRATCDLLGGGRLGVGARASRGGEERMAAFISHKNRWKLTQSLGLIEMDDTPDRRPSLCVFCDPKCGGSWTATSC